MLVNYRLPFLKAIIASLYFAWSNKAELLRAIALPTLAIVAVWALVSGLQDKQSGMVMWLILPIYGLGFSFFAVTCHRLILVESRNRYRYFREKPGYRELRFLGWVVVVYTITTLFKLLLVFVILNSSALWASAELREIPGWVKEVVSIPALYVLARLSLIFPAAAIDSNVSLKWSWEKTRGNGWRLFVVVGLFPWLIEHALELMARDGITAAEWVLLAIFAFIGLAVGIIALSFSYTEFKRGF